MNNIDISKLKYSRHPKIDKELYESIKEKGILVPIIVNKNNTIFDGVQRYLIAKKLGMKTIPVIK